MEMPVAFLVTRRRSSSTTIDITCEKSPSIRNRFIIFFDISWAFKVILTNLCSKDTIRLEEASVACSEGDLCVDLLADSENLLDLAKWF
jgi:hypothetical protein